MKAYDKEEFIQTLAVMYKDNKSIAIATDTRLASICFYEMLSGKTYDPSNIDDTKFIIYNSDTSSNIDITTVNMLDKIIIYTPSMDVSVSITEYTPHTIFGFFTNDQISSYCKSQMLMRFRNTENVMIYEKFDLIKNPSDKLKMTLFELEHERYSDICIDNELTVANTLSNMAGMCNFKFLNLQESFNRFVAPAMNCKTGLHQYNMHKTFKKMATMNDLLKISRRPKYERREDKHYSKFFNELYSLNTQKYLYGIHIESLLGEIVDIQTRNNDTDVSRAILIVMERYQWAHLNKYSSQELRVKGALSIIYHMSSYYDTHQYSSLDDFKQKFLARNHIIRLFIAIVRSKSRKVQMFLTFLLRSIFEFEDSKYYIDMNNLQYQSCSISLEYFKKIRKSKVRYYIKKYLPSIGIMESNPDVQKYPYVNIFENAARYKNYTDSVNVTRDDDDSLCSKSTSSTYLSRYVHQIDTSDLGKYIAKNENNKEINLQFTILTRRNNNIRVLTFLKDVRRSGATSSVSSNVYNSMVYEYIGKHGTHIHKMLDKQPTDRCWIVLRPIENELTNMVSKERISAYIDSSIAVDLDIYKYMWKSHIYAMYENKAIQILSMLETDIEKLFKKHEHASRISNKESGFEPLVIYKPNKPKKKTTTGFTSVKDIDESTMDQQYLPSGIIQDFCLQQQQHKKQQQSADDCHVHEYQQQPTSDDEGFVDTYVDGCMCLVCMPGNNEYMKRGNSIHHLELIRPEILTYIQQIETYRESRAEQLDRFAPLTLKIHNNFSEHDLYLQKMIHSIINDPTCYSN